MEEMFGFDRKRRVPFEIECAAFVAKVFSEQCAKMRPWWLGKMELDAAHLASGIAFEFQDPYHYTSAISKRMDAKNVIVRDLVKAQICAQRDIILITMPFSRQVSTTVSTAIVASSDKMDLAQLSKFAWDVINTRAVSSDPTTCARALEAIERELVYASMPVIEWAPENKCANTSVSTSANSPKRVCAAKFAGECARYTATTHRYAASRRVQYEQCECELMDRQDERNGAPMRARMELETLLERAEKERLERVAKAHATEAKIFKSWAGKLGGLVRAVNY